MDMETIQNKNYVRNIDDVKSIIKHAKLDEKNLTQITQVIYYPDENIKSENIKLLELDNHLLDQIKNGEKIEFKGGTNEKVVLCTNDRTYDVKIAEISNSLLLVPNLKFAEATSTSPLKSPKNCNLINKSIGENLNSSNEDDELLNCERILERKDVLKVFHEYFECRQIQPRFRKLYDLLQYTRYSGPQNEYCIDKKMLFTFDQLLDTVQCCRKEFLEGLKKYRVIKIDGYMRILEYDYEYGIINIMLGIINENSWNLNEIDREITIELMEGIAPKEIVTALFDLYTKPSDNEGKFQYDEEMIARIIAQHILQPGLKFHIDDFLKTWQEALPEGMSINEKYLRGLGIIDRESPVHCVRSLAEDNLSTDLHDRLRMLFKMKRKWTLEEIEPYIEYFATPECPVTSILAKHARSMTVNGQRYYVAKHT